MASSTAPATWLRFQAAAARLTLRIHAQPNARSTEPCGLYESGDGNNNNDNNDALKIRVAAPAVDDKANATLLVWIAKELNVPKSSVRLVSGAKGRDKVIEISDATQDVADRAAALADEG